MSDSAPKAKGIADIVFLIDVTGSMSHCIDALQANLQSFVQVMTHGDGSPNSSGPLVSDWRIKVVGYRDYPDRPSDWLEEFPFSSDVEEVGRNIRSLVARGGGDEPESLLDALHKVATMGDVPNEADADPELWRGRSKASRVVAVFTDASFHPKMSYPAGAGGTVEDIGLAVTQSKIILEIIAPEMDCYSDLFEIDKCNVQMFPFDESDLHGAARAMSAFTADRARFASLMEMLAKTVSKSTEAVAL